ncbi:MAG: hypothetical protein WC679_10215 [Bacteroidales bacterium]|jgi:hypothetical protein
MRKIKTIFILLLIFNRIGFAQTLTSSNITNNSATISFTNSESQSLNLHVFIKSVEDTIIYTENFSGFPKVYLANYFGGYLLALNLPSTYTNLSNCKGRNLFNTNGDSCSFNTNGEFITPFLDLSKSGGNYRIKFKAKGSTASNIIMRIYQSDSSENYSNYSNVVVNKNTSKAYDSLFTAGTSNARIKFYSPYSNLIIDDLSISYISTTKTPIASSPFNTSSNSINLTYLNPNTIYHCFIEGRTDTISFTTLDWIKLNSISDITPNTAKINFSSPDNTTTRKLIVKKKSNYQTVFADDLFISEYTTAGTYNKAIEIYNGTGKDICLQSYSLYYSINSGSSHIDTTFSFSQYDTIKSSSCIVLMEYLENLSVANEGYFYKHYKLGALTVTGDDAIAIIKDGNYIDIFGCIGQDPGNGWTSGTSISTYQTTLRRNSSVSSGIKTNPTSGFPTLGTEWTQIGIASSTTTASNFEDFGKHTMNNAFGDFDSLALNIGVGISDNVYYLSNLEEGTIYEAFLVIGTGNDTVVSNSIEFKTGVNTQRTASGDWNDDNWSKGIPASTDNAIILNGQKIIIPDGFTAKCYNLIIKDTLSQTKASLINNGSLDITNKAEIEAYFNGYTSNANGWYLFGLPISVYSSFQDTIGNNFFKPTANDDLYYWQEDYTDIDNNGRWINWKDIPIGSGDFFIDTRGYLISYAQNTQLEFSGQLNNNASYSLLNNASLSIPNNERGWHLCSNPYPFYISMDNLQRTNVSLPSLLDPETSNYIALIQSDSIPPFAGFMGQVSNSTNAFSATKATNSSKASIIPQNILTLKVSSNQGSDKTRLIIMDSTTLGYDVKYDNRKLHGYGLSPEIFSKIVDEDFAVNAIPNIEDSLVVDINFISKVDENYRVTLDIDNKEDFEKVALYDKASNTELINFMVDTAYTFYSSAGNNQDKFQLKIYKNLSSIEEVKSNETISLQQKEDEVAVVSSSKIKSLQLTNMKGQIINKNSKTNKIRIPEKGVFILTITTSKNKYQRKVINL